MKLIEKIAVAATVTVSVFTIALAVYVYKTPGRTLKTKWRRSYRNLVKFKQSHFVLKAKQTTSYIQTLISIIHLIQQYGPMLPTVLLADVPYFQYLPDFIVEHLEEREE